LERPNQKNNTKICRGCGYSEALEEEGCNLILTKSVLALTSVALVEKKKIVMVVSDGPGGIEVTCNPEILLQRRDKK